MIRVNDNEVEWHEGMTVTDVLNAMNYDFPLITVVIDGVRVPAEDYDTHRVPDGADVKAIHLHHGG